ncbi:MAG: histidinol dehydrogenase [Solirubrobacterales bacterium]
MRFEHFEWRGAGETATALRAWALNSAVSVDVTAIEREVIEGGDQALMRLTERFDATERPPGSLRIEKGEAVRALEGTEAGLRAAMELAAANVRIVAEAQIGQERQEVELPQGHTVSVREVSVGAGGVYAPGGRAAYPSSVLMCCIPARVAGVKRLVLASPPRPDGSLDPLVLAAAALCEVDEIYAIGGAQAIFALAHGTETVAAVDVIAGPGNAWVREAKRAVYGRVGIDSLAGPSELMLIAGHDTDPEWAALDLCAQAEHGADSPLVAVAVEEAVLDAIEEATGRVAAERSDLGEVALALVQVPDLADGIDLANAFAPEHLELLEEDAALLAERVRTAGCVFAGRNGATAFGDYVAGSNHVLPTGGAGRFSGPLGPGAFRRKITTVSIPGGAASRLAPYVDLLAQAEGFPIHGESAMIRR